MKLRKVTTLFVALSVPFAPTEAKAQTSRGQETPTSGVFKGETLFRNPSKKFLPLPKKNERFSGN